MNLISDLIARKAGMEEGEEIDRIAALDGLIEAEFEGAKSASTRYEKQDWVEKATRLARDALDNCDRLRTNSK